MKPTPDVQRWADSGDDAPQGLAQLLRAGREQVGATSEVAELARRLSAALGPASGLPGGEAPRAASGLPDRAQGVIGAGHAPLAGGPVAVARGALNGRSIVRLASWALGGVGTGAALWLVLGGLSRAPSVPPSPATGRGAEPLAQGAAPSDAPARSPAPAEAVIPRAVEAAPAAPPLPTVASGDRPSAAPRGRAPTPRAPTAPQINEAALLQRAQGALQQHPAEALELTRRHQARFPHGVLAEEREVIAIEALQRLGRHDAARSRAAAFERRYQGSVHRPRLSGGADTSAPVGGALNTPE